MVGSKTEAGLQLRGLPELALIVWRHGLMQPFQPPSPESLPASSSSRPTLGARRALLQHFFG